VNGAAKRPKRTEASGRILEAIGAYATGELEGEDASAIERFVRENEEGRRLAEAFLRALTLLRTIHEGQPEPPKEIVERAIAQVAEETRRAPHADESARNPNHDEDSFKEVPRSMFTPTLQDPQQGLKQALRAYTQGLEALENALVKFEEALLDLEEEVLNESAAERPKSQNLRLLSIPEVCQELGWDRGQVFRRLRSGEIPSLKLGHAIKVRQRDLEEYIKSHRRPQ
jgi:excisionase family DNA binding protein